MNSLLKLLIVTLSLGLAVPVLAENSQKIGGYVVHFNALPTESLPPSVARAYGITRSGNRGLLNISVLKDGGGFSGVEADVEASATNLTGQLRNINLRKIEEQNAVYYISEFSVANQETLDFSVKVTAPDGAVGFVKFRQKFYAN
jgi:hypothetical protein